MALILLFGFLQFGAPADSNLMQVSKSQANYYISNIEQYREVKENVWALTILTASHPEIRKEVEKKVRENSYSNELLDQFREIEPQYGDQLEKIVFKTGSKQLLIDLLLVTEKDKKNLYRQFISKFDLNNLNSAIDYQKLLNAILNEDSITEDILLDKSFSLSHLFLLYRAHGQLSDSYINTLTDSWEAKNKSEQTLSSSLYHAGYLRILYLKYDYSQTAEVFHQLIEDRLFPNSDLKLRLYKYLDYSMYRLGYYDRSLQIVRQYTLPTATYLGNNQERINTKQLQGVYLYSIGKIRAAEQVYKEVLEEISENKINISRSSLYNNLALVYNKLGKYDDYLDLQYKALEIAKTQDNYSHRQKILRNLFVYYRESKDSTNALNYLTNAKDLAVKNSDSTGLGTIYTFFGSFYRKSNYNYEKADSYYSKAKEILNPKNNKRQYLKLSNEIASNFEDRGEYKKALKIHDEIIELTSEEKGIDYLDALVNKAHIYLKQEDIKQAGDQIKEFKSFSLDQLDFNQIIKANKIEADYLFQTGNISDALNILEPALNQIVVRAKSSTDLKSGFWHVEDEYLDAFELAASIYMDTGQPGKAVEKLDQLKTINDASLYQNPLVKSSLLDESELTEYKQITEQLDVIRKKLLTAPEEQQFRIRQQINQLNTKKRKYDRRLSKNIDLNPTSIRQIQNKLSARELIFHITELNDQYYFAKISRSEVDLKTIELTDQLRDLFSNSVQQLATKETNLDSLYKISQILELQQIPDYVEKITLIPDSYFYQLPLDILPLKKPSTSYSYGEATYAIEKFKTQYLTTLEDFKSPNRSTSASKSKMSYVGYGVSNFDNYSDQSLVPLPYAQSEVSIIANGLTNLSQVQTYVNEQSTKSTFKQTAPHSRIIHLATHSEVSERDPMFSTVYFSKKDVGQDDTFDDRFFAYELFEMDLSNEMIMLNSCESGSGSYIQGTGVMGISRALRYAGAESLVLNLWSVNDMLASDFAIHFYSKLNEGKSKPEALRSAKKHFLNNKNADPHFWGPYMLIGDTESIVEPQRNKNLAMAGAFIFYFMLMLGLSYFSQQGIIFSKR